MGDVIDVAAGDKIPRKGGPGITRSDLLVINKPVGLVVHPAAGNPAGTLVKAAMALYDLIKFFIDNAKRIAGLVSAVAGDNVGYVIDTAPAASADPNYNLVDPANVSASNTDDDVAGLLT